MKNVVSVSLEILYFQIFRAGNGNPIWVVNYTDCLGTHTTQDSRGWGGIEIVAKLKTCRYDWKYGSQTDVVET